MLVITGLGRCGTSFLAYFMQKMGYYQGKVRMQELERAGMENSLVWQLNKDIRGEKKIGTWKSRIREITFPVIKDVRFTWGSIILRTWWEVRQDMKLMILTRHIKDIIQSRKYAKPNWDDERRGDNIEFFRSDFREFMYAVGELGIPYETLRFPNFLCNYETVYCALRNLGYADFDKEKGQEYWGKIVRFDRVERWKRES